MRKVINQSLNPIKRLSILDSCFCVIFVEYGLKYNFLEVNPIKDKESLSLDHSTILNFH